jgi:hypothetical protein
MATIIPILQDDAFGPEALRAMSTALEEVCRVLKLDHDQGAREAMALHIIQLARHGERDPERLRDRVLREAGATHVAQQVLDADAQLAQSGVTSSA